MSLSENSIGSQAYLIDLLWGLVFDIQVVGLGSSSDLCHHSCRVLAPSLQRMRMNLHQAAFVDLRLFSSHFFCAADSLRSSFIVLVCDPMVQDLENRRFLAHRL